MKFTDEDLAMMSPSEREIAQQGMAATEAGRDPLAEIDRETEADPPASTPAPAPAPAPAAAAPTQAPAAPAPAPAPADANVDPNAAPAQAPAPAPAPAADATPPAQAPAPAPAPMQPPPAPQMPTYTVNTEQVQAQVTERTKLRGDIAAIDQKWADGEITTEERLAQITPLQDKVDTINGNLAVTQALAAANQQSIGQYQQAVIADITQRGAAIGLDYANKAVLQDQFNAVLEALEANPANHTLTFQQLAEKAHNAVMLANGIAPTAAAPAPAAGASPTPPTRATPPAPPTLRDMPAAQRANEGFAQGTLADQVLAGDAMQAEENWNRLTPAQREALLKG